MLRLFSPKEVNRTSNYSRFIQAYPEYTKTTKIDQLRASDYARLDELGHTYLDYTGGNLYAERQISKHFELLRNHVFGNPHSNNPTSLMSTELVEEARQAVLDYFRADNNYFCVFTANASNAIKIVGECYPFAFTSQMLLTFDNHNSVNGLREYARRKGCRTSYVPVMIENLRMNESKLSEALNAYPKKTNKLFAYPAQSNVSGVKHRLSWVEYAQERGWDVLLDAAAFVPTDILDLHQAPANFVSISFYKIFGYPTGLGCLLIRKDSFEKLHKPWFAGGTVSLASVLADDYILMNNHEKFEDGTVNYLDIPAIKIGLEHISEIGMETIRQRVVCLTGWLISQLNALQHTNGNPVVRLLGPVNNENRGGTIIMNFYNQHGHKYPFAEVEQRANEWKISLRTGCFCNPGIDELSNALRPEHLMQFFTSQDAKSALEMNESIGTIRGAIRISLGLASNFADVDRFMEFAESFVDR